MKTNRPRGFRRGAILTAIVCLLTGFAWAAEPVPPTDNAAVARKLLDWRKDVPSIAVRVPLQVYARFLLARLVPPAQPAPPVERFLSQAHYNVTIKDGTLSLTITARYVVLNPQSVKPLPTLPAGPAWRDVQVGAKPVTLRRDGDRLMLDNPIQYWPGKTVGPYSIVVSATTDLRARTARGVYTVELPGLPDAALSTLEVASEGAWQVNTPRAPLTLVGTKADGTHGTLGLTLPSRQTQPALRLPITWQEPRPADMRIGRPLYDCHMAWHLTDRMQEVRARLDVRIAGGACEKLELTLPTGADNIQITGPDVRAVDGLRVALKGRVRGATRLFVKFSRPWPAGKGATTLSGLSLRGGSLTGGTLIVTSDADGVLLEDSISGAEEIGLGSVPADVAALAPAQPVLAWELTGRTWRAGVDLVSLSELPIRDTLVDEADHTVLLRPSGETMHKVALQVRNRSRQFLPVWLPGTNARLLLARVSGKPVIVTQGRAGALLVPLEQSVQTIGGALSFPVEIVFVTRVPALTGRGRLRVPLLRTGIPAARARCTLRLPDGLRISTWEGDLRATSKLTAVTGSMTYGQGHQRPGAADVLVMLGDNYVQSATTAFQAGKYDRAKRNAYAFLNNPALQGNPRAADVRKILSDIQALNDAKAGGGRSARAGLVQMRKGLASQNIGNLAKQQRLLEFGKDNLRVGDKQAAAEAFRAAEQAGQAVRADKMLAQQQHVILAESQKWLKDYTQEEAKEKLLRGRIAKLEDKLLQEATMMGRVQTEGGGGGEQPQIASGTPPPSPDTKPGERGKYSAQRRMRVLVIENDRLRKEIDAVKRRGSGYEGGDADDADDDKGANVNADAILARQRMAGKDREISKRKSADEHNKKLEGKLQKLEAQLFVPAQADAPPDELIKAAENMLEVRLPADARSASEQIAQAARELAAEGRYAEADEVLNIASPLEKRALRVDTALDRMEVGRYDEAERMLDDLEREDPSDLLIKDLRTALAALRKRDGSQRITPPREQGRKMTGPEVKRDLKLIYVHLEDGRPMLAQKLVERILSLSTASIASDDAVSLLKARRDVRKALDKQGESARAVISLKEQRDEFNRQRAERLTKEAHTALYDEMDPKKAFKLATEALLRDPKNTLANDIRFSAGITIKDGRAVRSGSATPVSKRLEVRRQAAIQKLRFHYKTGRDLLATGKHDRALKELRSALIFVEMLEASARMNMNDERAEIKRLIDVTIEEKKLGAKALRDRQDRDAGKHGKRGGDDGVREWIAHRAKLVDAALDRMEAGLYDEAERILDNLEMEDPSDLLVHELRMALTVRRNRDEFRRINFGRDQGNKLGQVWAAGRIAVPSKLVKHPESKFWVEVIERRGVTRYQQNVQQQLKFGWNDYQVGDLVKNEAEGKRLAEMLNMNYAQPVRNAAPSTPFVKYEDGRLKTRGIGNARRVGDAIENMRRNWGQKVAYSTRELALTPEAVKQLGVKWNTMKGGQYATVDEAQLNALLMHENTVNPDGYTVHKGLQEIVPGTHQTLPNRAVIELRTAVTFQNWIGVNGDVAELPHDQTLLTFANGRIIAVRAGATQHWTEEAAITEIKEVPVEINVPKVGTPVKFEKVLVKTQDKMIIEADYKYTKP